MSMYSYGIGGNEVKLDASEGIAEIPGNKTLLVQKLTADDPVAPEPVQGLKTVEDVFDKFQPKVEVEFETSAGETRKEQLEFHNLGDFNPPAITRQSPFLNGLNIQQEQYTKIARQLSSNKVLQKALADETTRKAVLQAIEEALLELESAK